jgi:hypothetical protein
MTRVAVGTFSVMVVGGERWGVTTGASDPEH